jgi:predicted anti-sigma-YlaC factor YlaD
VRSPADLLRRRNLGATTLDCEQVARAIETQLDSGGEPSAELVSHVERCVRCQAELARHHKLLRLLAHLRDEVVVVPDGLVSGVLAAVGDAAQRRAIRAALRRQSFAYAGGVGAALAVVAVVAVARKRTVRERHA